MSAPKAVKHPRTEACLGGGKKTIGVVRSDLEDLCRALEDESAYWKRMHECAQNANAYRQDALECGADIQCNATEER